MLPFFQKSDSIQYGWYAVYFLAVLTSITAWTVGTHVRLPKLTARVSASTAKRVLLAASLPFVLYYIGTGNFFAHLSSITSLSVYQLRVNHWQSFGAGGDPILFLTSCAAYPSALLWPIAKPRSMVFYYSLFIFGLFAAISIAGGSRMVLVFSALTCLLLLHTKYRIRPIVMLRARPAAALSALCLAFFALYYVFYYVLAERVPGLSTQYEALSLIIVGARPTSLMQQINEFTGGTAGVVAISVSYFSSPLTFFEAFMRDRSQCGCFPSFGVYNFPFLDNVLGGDWFEIRARIAHFWMTRGVGQNPWATSYRDFFIDFGWIGSFVFNALIFFLLGAFARSAAAKRDDVSKLIVAYIAAFVLVTPLLSPLLILVVSLPLYGLVIGGAFIAQQAQASATTKPVQHHRGGLSPRPLPVKTTGPAAQ